MDKLTQTDADQLLAQPVLAEMLGLKIVAAPAGWNDDILWAYNANNLYIVRGKLDSMKNPDGTWKKTSAPYAETYVNTHSSEIDSLKADPAAYIAEFQYRLPGGQGTKPTFREFGAKYPAGGKTWSTANFNYVAAATFCNGSLEADKAELKGGALLTDLVNFAFDAAVNTATEEDPNTLTPDDFECYYRHLAAEALGGTPEDF